MRAGCGLLQWNFAALHVFFKKFFFFNLCCYKQNVLKARLHFYNTKYVSFIQCIAKIRCCLSLKK